MKKYKDMRFTIIIGTMAALLFILTNYTMVVSKDFTRGAIGYVICVLAVSLLIFSYNVTFDDSYLVTYEWKVIMLIPVLVEYKDIRSFEVISKHRIKVGYLNRTTNLYVFNAAKANADYQMLKAAFDDKKNKNKKKRKKEFQFEKKHKLLFLFVLRCKQRWNYGIEYFFSDSDWGFVFIGGCWLCACQDGGFKGA